MAGPKGTLTLERYERDAKRAVADAQRLADEQGHAEVTPLHLLMCLLADDVGVGEVFRRAGGDPSVALSRARAALERLPRAKGELAYVSQRLLDLLARAEREATRGARAAVAIEDLLNAIAQEIAGPTGEVLASLGMGPGAFRKHAGALAEARAKPAAKPPDPVSAEVAKQMQQLLARSKAN
jgi:ATP-dependent Clp protease ATP-binding subunit ClpB